MSVFVPSTIHKPESRHIALLRISPTVWLDLIHQLGERRITQKGLPSDAKIVATNYDPWRDCIVLMLEHESFEEISEGAFAPELQVMLTDHGPWPLDVADSA